MSHMDEILARSRSKGQFVERSRFSLSRDKAVEKIREFSLRHPEQYVLELVQAALFSGASYIAVHIEDNETVLAWVGGAPITGAQLRRIFDYLFIRSTRNETRHLHQLAIGVNAVLQRKPSLLRIESGDGTLQGTACLELKSDGEFSLGESRTPLAGSYLRMVFPQTWTGRFRHLLGAAAERPETTLIKQRCAYTSVPILLNGEAPFGWKASRKITLGPDSLSFDTGSRRGAFGIPSGPSDRRTIHVVVGGVIIRTAPIPELGLVPGRQVSLSGVICDDSLRKTADQSDIVQDEAWNRMLHALQPIATQLIEAHLQDQGRLASYVPPVLPQTAFSSVDTVATPGEATAVAPIPSRIQQIDPRPNLPLSSLGPLLESGPVFYVHPNDLDSVKEMGDPCSFPYPVLVLTTEQAESASIEHAPHGPLRISSAGDIAFVRRALSRDLRTVEARFDFSGPSADLDGELQLVFTQRGPRKAWANPRSGTLPILAARNGSSIWCDHIDLPFPFMHALLHLSEDPGTLTADTLSLLALELSVSIQALAWNLFTTGQPAPCGSRPQQWASALLEQHAQPQVFRENGCIELRALLPLAWGSKVEALLDLSLIEAVEGPVTLQRLASAQGTDDVFSVEDYESNIPLLALESRFGFGHLWARSHQEPFLIFVGGFRHAKPSLDACPDWPDAGHASLLFWISAERYPRKAPHGWQLETTGIAHLGCAISKTANEDVNWDTWIPNFEQALNQHLSLNPSCHNLGGRLSDRRARAAIRMVSLGLGARSGQLYIKNANTLEELRLAESISGQPASLTLDDAPSVWQSLREPESPDWLARNPVQWPGVRGWIGLREPYDDTGGILVQSFNELWSEKLPDASLPCHAWLHLDVACNQLDARTMHLFRQAQRRLYEQVLAQLRAGRPENSRTAHQYALHFLAPRVLAPIGATAKPPSLALLSNEVQVFQNGTPWGSFRDWCATPEDKRPILPDAIRETLYRTADQTTDTTQDAMSSSENKRLTTWLHEQVAMAMGLSVQGHGLLLDGNMPPIEVHREQGWVRGKPVELVDKGGLYSALRCDPGTQLFQSALSETSSTARIMLALECCRILSEARASCGGRAELHAAHQVLMARLH